MSGERCGRSLRFERDSIDLGVFCVVFFVAFGACSVVCTCVF